MVIYDPFRTPYRDVVALCNLTLHDHPYDGITGNSDRCELRDSEGAVVFTGKRFPDSMLFMRRQCGLTPNVELPADWYA